MVQHDPDKFSTTILIEGRNGQVAWADILAGLARAKGFEDSAFSDLIPAHSFPLNAPSTRWGILAWNLAFHKEIRLTIVAPEKNGQEMKLAITLDRAALLASQRRFQKNFREATVKTVSFFWKDAAKKFGLTMDEDWHQAPPEKPLVVVVPGFHFSVENADHLAAEFKKLGFTVGVLHYPTDQPIEDSARLLADELRRLANQHKERKIRIVAFSMGGLVARRALEDPQLDPGNVVQLVMVATPNHGSRLACFGFGLEIWEHTADTKGNPLQKFYAAIEDGLSEASEDLDPDSIFLKQLNALPRNPRIRYSLFLGTGGMLTEASLEQMRKSLKAQAGKNRFTRFFGPKLEDLLADLDEVVRGKGDGAVALKRGKLDGVQDTLILDFDHMGIARPPLTPADRRLRQEIIDRLKKKV